LRSYQRFSLPSKITKQIVYKSKGTSIFPSQSLEIIHKKPLYVRLMYGTTDDLLLI
jgi:hypothetical protein